MTKKSREPRRWYTIAYFTAEGVPHPAHRHDNFTRVYGQLAVHLDTMSRVMRSDVLRRGAHAGAIWPGQLSEWEAIHGDVPPVLYVYEGGRVERS